MSAFVITDEKQPGAYLGIASWTKHRPHALEFRSQADAQHWIDHLVTTKPRLYAHCAMKVTASKLDADGYVLGSRVVTDYDPHGAA